MKHSTVSTMDRPEPFDTAKAVRAAMGAEQVSASDLSRAFGGAVSYWTRRITGQLPFSNHDLDLIAWATGHHAAEFLGGQAPQGWQAPARPFRGMSDTHEYTPPTCVTAGTTRQDWALAS